MGPRRWGLLAAMLRRDVGFQNRTARHASRVNCRTDQALSELKTPYNEHVSARQHPQCLRNGADSEGGCASSRSGSTSLLRLPH
jgi:uncharacterized protein (DUF2461 family)